MATQKTWPGLELTGPLDRLEAAEAIVCATLDQGDLLGTARQTWRAEDYPACERDADAPDGAGAGCLQIFLAHRADARASADAIERALGRSNLSDLRLRPLATPDADWATQWRDFFRPIRISDRLLVLPAWWDAEEALRQTGLKDADLLLLRIEPGQAFGSGTHATTRLCLRTLERLVAPGDAVLDFGAGSGILTFAAAGRGARSIVAIEIDPDARRNFEENAELNRAVFGDCRIDYRTGSSEVLESAERFDCIVCNALFHRVSNHFPALAERLADGGRFLYSGFLLAERDAVEARLGEIGLQPIREDSEEEWGAVVTHRA